MKDYYEECKRLEEEEEERFAEAIREAQNENEEVDDDYSQNAPCDNTGMCAGSSCPYFWNCQN